MLRAVFLLGLLLVASGCASTPPASARLYRNEARHARVVRPETPLSLFPGDHEVLSDQEIARVLNASFQVPTRGRIAILHLEHRGTVDPYGPYASARMGADADAYSPMLAALTESALVETASVLPSFLVPAKRTIGYLREAAARYQADVLLIVRTKCELYEKSRWFGSAKPKAVCTAEAAVLDTRTGLVPFTTVVYEDFVTEKSESDAEQAETRRRAEIAAVGAALQQGAREFTLFLESLEP